MTFCKKRFSTFIIIFWILVNSNVVFLNIIDTFFNSVRNGNLSEIDVIDPAIKELVYRKVKFVLIDENSSDGVTFQINNYNKVNLDIQKTTKVLIHGWNNDQHSDMPQTLGRQYFYEIKSLNIILVDWSEISKIVVYPLPANGTTIVGECVADVLMTLYSDNPTLLGNVHIIGHSLGAHVSGFAGRRVKKNSLSIGRITGLDPANPLISNGLSAIDANFVDVIHTSSGTLGKGEPVGHADFYPNGGTVPQPGCTGIAAMICSHSRSWQFFAKSIRNPTAYLAHRCVSYGNFLTQKCDGTAYMGEGVQADTHGLYFLLTDPKEDFYL